MDGLKPEQVRATAKRGGWGAAGIPTLADFVKTGAWFCDPPEEFVTHLQRIQAKYPGLEFVNVGSSTGTPKAVMLEPLSAFAREVMPKFAPAVIRFEPDLVHAAIAGHRRLPAALRADGGGRRCG